MFDLHRELYDGHEFILIIPSLGKNHEAEVGRLVVQLSKDAHWDADAPNYLQHVTIIYGSEHIKTFANLVEQLPRSERTNLIDFLTTKQLVVNAQTEFQGLIDDLRSAGREDLAKELEASREKQARRLRR